MPVSFKQISLWAEWYFTVSGENGKVLCWGGGYNNKANAIKGATAAAKELNKWLDARKKKLPPKAKSQTTARQKPVGRRST